VRSGLIFRGRWRRRCHTGVGPKAPSPLELDSGGSMAKKKIRRQAATSKGTLRRVADARLDLVFDPREQKRVVFPLGSVLQLIVAGIASGANSLRAIETRSEQLGCGERGVWGLPDERIADNTMGSLLRIASSNQLRSALHRQVKAEHRRGRLEPTRFADDLRVAAIDGKVLSTLWWRDLVDATRAVLRSSTGAARLEADFVPTPAEVRAVFATQFPHVQLMAHDDGTLYGLVRTHRTTLVSSEAAVCLDVRPIPAVTNEIGAMGAAVEDLRRHYGHTSMIDVITADAGNTSLAVANTILDNGWDYFLCIKSPHGAVYEEAERLLGGPTSKAQVHRTASRRDGVLVVHEVRQIALPNGYLGWTHARQLVRIVRKTTDKDGQTTQGERYYVSSFTCRGVPPQEALKLCRHHWRSENDGHWTSDTILGEDARRTVGSRHPDGLLAYAVLRMIAQNILAALRATSLTGDDTRPSWATVCEHILKTVFPHSIESSVYDDVEDIVCAA
jgi:hypothetical protein